MNDYQIGTISYRDKKTNKFEISMPLLNKNLNLNKKEFDKLIEELKNFLLNELFAYITKSEELNKRIHNENNSTNK